MPRLRSRDRSRAAGGAPAPVTFVASAEGFSDADYLEAAGGPQGGLNTTLAILVQHTAVPTAEGYAWAHFDGTSGFLWGWTAGGAWAHAQRGYGNLFTTGMLMITSENVARAHCLVVATDATDHRWSVNGGAVTARALGGGAYVTTAAAQRVGRHTTDGYPGTGCAVLGVLALNELLSDADVRRLARSYETGRFPTDLAARAAQVWEAGRDWPAAGVASPTRGTLGVTLTPAGAPTRTLRPRIQLSESSASVADTGYDVAIGSTARRRNALARLRFTTDATSIDVGIWSTIQGTYPASALLAVFVNGAYYATLTATVSGARQVLTQALPAGLKTVDIVEGTQSSPSGTVLGTSVTDVSVAVGKRFDAVAPSAPARRFVAYGDSITAGGNATVPPAQSWVALTRAAFPGGVTAEAWGYRALFEDWSNGGNSIATLAAQLAALCDGTAANTLWLAIGTNDYGLGHWTAAAFQTQYSALLTALLAGTNATIYCQGPSWYVNGGNANAVGDNVVAYRTAVQAAATAAANARVIWVDGTTMFPVDQLDDAVHPSTTGHATYAASVRATSGY